MKEKNEVPPCREYESLTWTKPAATSSPHVLPGIGQRPAQRQTGSKFAVQKRKKNVSEFCYLFST